MKLSNKALNAFLNDHWENHTQVPVDFYERLKNDPRFIFSGPAFRGIISTEAAFNSSMNFKEFKSWSKTEEGLINFIHHEFIDGAFESLDDIVYVLQADITGIDINKIIRHLTENQQLDNESLKQYLKENEVIFLELGSEVKLTSYSLKDFTSLFKT